MSPENNNEKFESYQDHEKLFPVPDGYFESLPDVIMSRVKEIPQMTVVHSVDKKSSGATVMLRLFSYAASVAAALVISAGIASYFSDGTGSLAESISLTELMESEDLYEIDETVLAEAIDTEDLYMAEIPAGETEVEEYLIDQNSDISTLINDL